MSVYQPSKTSWQVYHAAGETCSTIKVSNLSTNISGPNDAWGRPNRPQPLQVSVEISFKKPFSTTSTGDALKGDTVHYGTLSKHVMKVVEDSAGLSLLKVVLRIKESLIGSTSPDSGLVGAGLLSGSEARFIKVTAHLPKATKLGGGVSITDSVVLEDNGSLSERNWGGMLKFHDLKVPVLIGVNANEREAKQLVVANVEIDRWAMGADMYDKIEGYITEVSPQSKIFGTMLTQRIRRWKSHHSKHWRLCLWP